MSILENKLDALIKAAYNYASESGMMGYVDDTKKKSFIDGALSNISKEYWYEKFKQDLRDKSKYYFKSGIKVVYLHQIKKLIHEPLQNYT